MIIKKDCDSGELFMVIKKDWDNGKLFTIIKKRFVIMGNCL